MLRSSSGMLSNTAAHRFTGPQTHRRRHPDTALKQVEPVFYATLFDRSTHTSPQADHFSPPKGTLPDVRCRCSRLPSYNRDQPQQRAFIAYTLGQS